MKVLEEKPSRDILDGWGDLDDEDDEDEFLDANSGKITITTNIKGKNLDDFDGWGVDDDEVKGLSQDISDWDAFEIKPKVTSKNDLNSVDFTVKSTADDDWSTDWEKVILF